MAIKISYINISSDLRDLRKKKGLTMKQFAESIGMSMRGWQEIEHGTYDIRLSDLKKISEVYDITLNVIFQNSSL